MTKKEERFFIHKDMVSDTKMKIPITLWQNKEQQKKFCDELNKLNDENEELKRKVDFYKYFQKDARELEKENEQLKKVINMLKTTIGRNEAYIKRLTHISEWHN